MNVLSSTLDERVIPKHVRSRYVLVLRDFGLICGW